MEEMTNIIPSMRFDEFKYSWKVTTLGEITRQYRESNKNVHHQNLLSLSYGKIVRKDIESKKGLLPASFDTYQIIKKDIIVFRVTDLQNDKKSLRVGISEEEGIITPAYVCMECDTRVVDPHYLYTLLHYYDDITKVYYKMGDGMRQTLAYSDLKELKVYLPNFSEQHKIVECFELLDKQIQISSKKIASLRQMKTASLHAMFPQKGETRPRVRFKGFEGDWETGKLSKFATRITRKNKNLETTLPITISAAEGLVAQDSFFNNIVASPNLRGYYLVKRGEFAYNKSYSSNYPFGAVKRLEKYDRGALSILYIVFTLNENISSDYIVHFFDTSLWHNEIAMRAAEGARNHGLLNIGAEDFLDINIVYPKSIYEQNEIAKYFTTLDKQISLEEQKLESLKRIKSACLDKIFV